MEKKYYRAKEVAEYLGVGVATVWRYSKQGKLNAKKLSASVTVFDIDEINELVSNGINGNKPVNQYDLNGKYIKTFKSIKEAAEQTNLQSSNISIACKQYTVGGFMWEFKENEKTK